MRCRSVLLFFLLAGFTVSSCFADLKLTNRITVEGRSFDGTVFIKNGKVRNELAAPGLNLIGIQDCAHHQVITINPRTKSYLVTDVNTAPLTEREQRSTVSASAPVTMTIDERDSGETKDLFGYRAHRMMGTITTEGGSGACKVDSHVSTDGWYIDLPGIESCTAAGREMVRQRAFFSGSCAANPQVTTTGVEQPGYPVSVTMSIQSPQGSIAIQQETTNIVTAPVDDALFEVPPGYKQAASYRALMGFPPAPAMRSQNGPASGPNFPPVTGAGANENKPGVIAGATHSTTETKPKVLRIAIAQITTSADRPLSVDGLQQELANDINFLGGEAVLLTSDPNDRDATSEQAKQHNCDYIIYTDINGFRTASVGQKLGSIFNRGGIGGEGGAADARTEMEADVKVFQPGQYTPVLDGNTNFRAGNADTTAKGLMHTEARTVMLQIKNLQKK
ncbi:MAG TPA: hypothetical protein VFQ00_03370 [Terriglobales bacterium]|nr:hypothetical protein [Terriglobales bacterium]